MRDCPYGICCPWVRGGWDLDALGKFVRRRRRRRHQGFRYFVSEFLLKVVILVISHENEIFGHLCLRKSFFKTEFPPKARTRLAKDFYF